jgi:predicted Zn finger-like uncharacterized protein
MQFSCDSCKTQLQIADEKVRGKRLIVRCKRCGAKITISDPALPAHKPAAARPAAPPASAPPRAAPAAAPAPAARAAAPAPEPLPQGGQTSQRDSDTESTRAMDSDMLEKALQASKADDPNAVTNGVPAQKAPAPSAAGTGDAPAWFAMLHGKQTGPLTRAELVTRTDEGAVGPRTYLWKEGMESWQRAKDLPELAGLFPQLPGPSAPPPPLPVSPGGHGSGLLREFSSSDFAMQDPAAEEKKRPQRAREPARASAAELSAQDFGSIEPERQAGKPPVPDPLSPPRKREPAGAEEERTPVDPLPLGELVHQEDVAKELFPAEQGPAQKSAVDLARWASDELAKKSSPALPKVPAPRPAQGAPRIMFESAAPPRSGGGLGVLLVIAVLAAAGVALWVEFRGTQKAEEAKPAAAPGAAPTSPVNAVPARPEPPPEAKPPEKPPAEPPTGLTADQVRRKLDENKPSLQACIDEALRRSPHLQVGKIHIATTIAPTGQVTSVKIDKRTVEESPLGTCLRRATRRIVFPQFAGDAFDVDIPIVVTAED